MRVVVSAGGTGGHIYPALAIISKIKEMDKNSEILYIGTTDRMEATIVPKTGINYIGIEMKGLNRKSIFKNVKVLSVYLKAKKKIRKILLDFKPDVVLGIGGYITLPVMEVATKLKIKTFIHEQNSIPGLSNKILSRKVDKIGVSLEDSIKYFDPKKTIFTGINKYLFNFSSFASVFNTLAILFCKILTLSVLFLLRFSNASISLTISS